MNLKFPLLLGLSILFQTFSIAIAQSFKVTGKVVAKSNDQPLSGVSITIKGTSIGTTSQSQGDFSINVPGANATLLFSYTGMISQEVKVSGPTNLAISLLDGSTALEEVIVVGYGTQKASKVSGAISTVKAEEIQKIVPVRAEEALQGRAAGVNVIQSGSPGSKPTVLIRGIPSFTGTDPVVIVDGVPQTLADFNSINASDIESISVLKDAATTAIYGVKGGNGVILVTTKSGRRNQKTEISANTNFGVQEVVNTIGVLNASEYGAMVNEGSTVAGGPVIFSDLTKLGVGTDWQRQIFKNAGFQSHNISARGGSDKMGYFLSTGFLNQGGIVGGSEKSHFNRGTFTANLGFCGSP